MIRNLTVACAGLLLAVIASYTLSQRRCRADFTYVNPSGVHTLDPARMSWQQDFRVALNIWEGLASTDPRTAEPVEGAALYPPAVSDEGRTYTFTIRDDARWSNGDRVTAADFLRGWRRGLEPGSAGDYQFLFTDHIAGVAGYIQWRVRAIGALTALARLRDGWKVDTDQARALLRHPEVCEALGSLAVSAGVAQCRGTNPGRPISADTLNSAEFNWGELYERIFRDHAARLDARFAAVGIRAPDDHTLVVALTRPCPYFPDLAAFPTFLPCHKSVELLREGVRGTTLTAEGLVVYDPQWTKPNYHKNGYPGVVTNGPYRPAEWEFKRSLRLTVNPYFRGAGNIPCRTIDMLVYGNISAALMAYEAGDVDFLPSMDVPYDYEIARLSRSGERPDFVLCEALATYFFNFNCASERVLGRANPFIDARIRRAFCLAIDKRRIVTSVLGRGDRIANTLVPPGAIPGYAPPAGQGGDAEAGRRMLAEAGYPGGVGIPPVDLLCVPSDERVCQAVAHMWERELGVQVELKCKESKTFAEDKANHRYMIARGNWYGDYYDATTFLDCLVTGNGNNDSGYSGPRYDALIARAKDTRDTAARAALLRTAESIIVEEDFPMLPILHYAVPIAVKPYVRGLYPNTRLRFPFRYVSVNR